MGGEMLPDSVEFNSKTNICQIYNHPGHTWFCSSPKFQTNSTCKSGQNHKILWNDKNYSIGTNDPDWLISDITNQEKYDLDRVYEDLIYEKIVEISSSNVSREKNPVSPYWHNKIYHDPILPEFSRLSNNLNRNFLNSTKIITSGDSILLLTLKKLVESLPKNYEILKEGNYNFLNLSDYHQDICVEGQTKWGVISETYKYGKNSQASLEIYSTNHGLPIAKSQCHAKIIFTSKIIERMINHKWFSNDKKYIFIFNHCAHFSKFHPIVFYNRLIEIRNSIIKYKKAALKQSPESKSLFIYETCPYFRGKFENLWAVGSTVNALHLRDMAFQVFGNPYELRDNILNDFYPVKVVDQYKYSEHVFDELETGNIHPRRIFGEELSHRVLNMVGYNKFF